MIWNAFLATIGVALGIGFILIIGIGLVIIGMKIREGGINE